MTCKYGKAACTTPWTCSNGCTSLTTKNSDDSNAYLDASEELGVHLLMLLGCVAFMSVLMIVVGAVIGWFY